MGSNILALTGFALLLIGAPSAHAAASAHDHGEHHKPRATHHAGYVKPGAAIEMIYDYDSQTEPGEFETFTATLSHIYADGSISAALLASPELQISAFTPIQNRSVYQGSILELPIQFSGTTNGVYSISIETVYESPSGQQSRRVLSIPVRIGAKTFEKSSPTQSKAVQTISNLGVVGLPAVEVIK